MKNFIFKSPQDLQKMFSIKLESIQKEQRHARIDLSEILRLLHRLNIDRDLGNQVDDYFNKDEDIPQDEDKEPD